MRHIRKRRARSGKPFVWYTIKLEKLNIGPEYDRLGRAESIDSIASTLEGQRFGLKKRQEIEVLAFETDWNEDYALPPGEKPVARWLVYVNAYGDVVIDELEAQP